MVSKLDGKEEEHVFIRGIADDVIKPQTYKKLRVAQFLAIGIAGIDALARMVTLGPESSNGVALTIPRIIDDEPRVHVSTYRHKRRLTHFV